MNWIFTCLIVMIASSCKLIQFTDNDIDRNCLNSACMIKVYSPECEHCKAFAPI